MSDQRCLCRSTEAQVQADVEASKGEEDVDAAEAGAEGEESKAPAAPKVKTLAEYEAEREAQRARLAEAFAVTAAPTVDSTINAPVVTSKYSGEDEAAKFQVGKGRKGKKVRAKNGPASKAGAADLLNPQSYAQESRGGSGFRGGRGGRGRFEDRGPRRDGERGPRRGGDRGGRGGRGPARGPRGPARGPRNQRSSGTPNIQDNSAFPALG